MLSNNQITPPGAAVLGCSEAELDAALDTVFENWGAHAAAATFYQQTGNFTETEDQFFDEEGDASWREDSIDSSGLDPHWVQWACGESYNY